MFFARWFWGDIYFHVQGPVEQVKKADINFFKHIPYILIPFGILLLIITYYAYQQGDAVALESTFIMGFFSLFIGIGFIIRFKFIKVELQKYNKKQYRASSIAGLIAFGTLVVFFRIYFSFRPFSYLEAGIASGVVLIVLFAFDTWMRKSSRFK